MPVRECLCLSVSSAQLVANAALSLLNLCCYLLDRQLEAQAAQQGVSSIQHRIDYATRIWQAEQALAAQQARPAPPQSTRKPAIAPAPTPEVDESKMNFIQRCEYRARQREAAMGQMG